MRIDHLCISNKRIHLNDISMDFSLCGIYLIKGEIGCGKTTLMETLMFDDYSVSFPDSVQADLFWKDRCKLFTYIPQNCCVTSLSVKEYIKKSNRAITDQAIASMFKEFELSGQLLDKPFSVLSGGEQVKVAIMTGLLKGTPYLFLDEPTNNLDNQTVDLLCKVLTTYAKSRRIIIISHDPRLNLQPNTEYIFEKKTVKARNHGVIESQQETISQKPNVIRPGFFGVVFRLAMNTPFIVTLLTLFCILGGSLYLAHIMLQHELITEKPPEEGYVFAKYSNQYDSILERYAKAENLQIDESRYEEGVPLDQIPELYAANDVKEIYIHDTEYIDDLQKMINTGQYSDSLLLFSMPAIWYTDFYDLSGIDLGLSLTNGSLPQDHQNEVAISKALLIKDFGYSEEAAEQAIGDQILISDERTGLHSAYTITGFTYYDIAVISYDPAFCYGIYHYSPDTYDAFSKSLCDYLVKIDATPNTAEEILIRTEPKSERKLLNLMMQEYPANYYYSNVYVQIWAKQFNRSLFIKLLIINLTIAVVSALILYLMNKNAIAYNMQFLTDFGNYYLDRKKMYCYYAAVLLSTFCLCAAAIFALNVRFSRFWRFSSIYLLINAIIIFLPFAYAVVSKKGEIK